MSASAPFTPAREEARVDALLATARTRGLDGPLWLLCPHEARRGALLDRLARAGGGWIQPLDWHGLLDLLELRLGLASRARLAPVDRVLAVESALELAAVRDPALAAALRGNALAVAHAVADVVDTLRLHGWDGALPTAPDRGAARVALAHLDVLSRVTRALEAHLDADGSTDLPRRLAALADVAPRSVLRGVVLWVEGVDHLTPRERRALDLAASCGAAVSLPSWITTPEHPPDPSSVAPSLLEALRHGAARCAADDGALAWHCPADPQDEAETVASIIEAHLASGGRPEDVAVVCGAESGAWPRVARALDRWDIPWNGSGTLPVQQTPLWQIVRASLRLAWNGPDAIDLATVLTAPGSGIFGTERDYFLSQLRRKPPSTWVEVRELLAGSTAVDEAIAASDAAEVATRRARGDQIRKRVGALLSAWEDAGPLQRHSADQRADALPAVFDRAVTPLLDAEAIARSVRHPRAQAAWIAAADAIRPAMDLVRRRLASAPHRARRLFDVERLLTDLEASFVVLRDGAPSPRRDGVALVGEDAWRCDHPAVLLVTSFVRGRYPKAPAPPLLLGAAERALLATLSADLAALPDEETLHALARRATLRVLSSPRRRLVLLSPRRSADGHRAEPALALRDLLDRLPPAALVAPPALAHHAPRARAAEAIRRLGRGDVATAVATAADLARADLAWRDLFAARFLPDTAFEVGDVAKALLRALPHDANDLESLLGCHYRYLVTSLLDLRAAPLQREARLHESVRHAISRDLIARLDAALATTATLSPAAIEGAIDESVQQRAPWSGRADLRDDRRRLLEDTRDLAAHYLEIRRALGSVASQIAPETPEARPLLSLPDGSPVMVRMPAATTLRVTAPGGETVPVLVQLTRQRATSLASRRDVGLDVEAALLSQLPTEGAGVVLRMNLGRHAVDGMVAEGSPAATAALESMVTSTGRSDWVTTAQLTLDDHVAATTARITEALAVVDAPGGTFAPLDRHRAESLDRVGALPCSRCEARLGCRVGLPGGVR